MQAVPVPTHLTSFFVNRCQSVVCRKCLRTEISPAHRECCPYPARSTESKP